MDRRDFVKQAAIVTAATAALATFGCGKGKPAAVTPGETPVPVPTTGIPGSPATKAAPAGPTAPVAAGKIGRNRHDPASGAMNAAIVSGADPAIMLAAAMKALGGVERFIHKGDFVCIKPNLAWGRTPETGAGTSPQILAAVIKLCKTAGAKEILVIEHPCDSPAVTFDMSGAAKVCKDLGVKLVAASAASMFKEVQLPQGVTLKSEMIANELLECDCYINVPCAKVHTASTVTLGMKNQMGAVWEPQRYHRGMSETQRGGNLHQNIVDLASGLRATLTVVDGTRALLSNGPKGPGKVTTPNKLIVSPDLVAADALAAPLLNTKGHLVDHIRIAGEMGLGSVDPTKMKVARVTI